MVRKIWLLTVCECFQLVVEGELRRLRWQIVRYLSVKLDGVNMG